AKHPKVSILIPNKDKISLLSACVDSIAEKVTYGNYEIVVIENNSVEPETFVYYEELQRLGKAKVIEWADSFNFSKIVNFGVRQTDGEYVLLLNNDTEVISPDFLETMMGHFQVEGVGVVGAKLLFPDGTVQHGGVVLGPYRSAGHLFASLSEDDLGYYCRAALSQNLSAVTGACQLIPRSVFEAVGGYTEAFEVGLNDVDFCLKVRGAGYRIVWTPYAKLFHYEFSSRGRDREGVQAERAEREIALLRTRWSQYYEMCDPYVGPNVDPDSLYFGLDCR
ncbi:MAG: glycosyltransferase family 2 protein, partial [Bacteroides sp.]